MFQESSIHLAKFETGISNMSKKSCLLRKYEQTDPEGRKTSHLKDGSRKETEVAGFFVFSHMQMMGYLGPVRLVNV